MIWSNELVMLALLAALDHLRGTKLGARRLNDGVRRPVRCHTLLMQVEACHLILVRRSVQHLYEVLELFWGQHAFFIGLAFVVVAIQVLSRALIDNLHVGLLDLAGAWHGRDIFELDTRGRIEGRRDVV